MLIMISSITRLNFLPKLAPGVFISAQKYHNEEFLGIKTFAFTCDKAKRRQSNRPSDNARKHIESALNNPDITLFTNELLDVIYTHSNDSDLDMLHRAIKKYQTQSATKKFDNSNFNFNIPFMRLLYLVDKPDIALSFALQSDNIFDHPFSIVILMNLLYKHKRYDDIIKVYESGRDDFKNDGLILELYLEALIEKNDLNSLNQAKQVAELFGKTRTVTEKHLKRCALVALNQNDMKLLQSILVHLKPNSFFLAENFQIIMNCRLNKTDQVIKLIESISKINKKGLVFKQTFEELKEFQKRVEDENTKQRLVKLIDTLSIRIHAQNDLKEFIVKMNWTTKYLESKFDDKRDKRYY